MLRLAIQKSGRLSEDSLQLIKACGISYPKIKSRLTAKAYNFPIEILYLRDDDIPKYVADGVADIGIVGENELFEKVKAVDVISQLQFSKCRMSIAIPRNDAFDQLSDLNGKRIATSYPVILKTFLEENNLQCFIQKISGSVEIGPSIGMSDAIFDIVESWQHAPIQRAERSCHSYEISERYSLLIKILRQKKKLFSTNCTLE